VTYPARSVLAIRIALAGWLVGWFWKAHFYAPFLLREGFVHPLDHDGLPAALQAPFLAAAAWAAPALAVIAILAPRPALVRAAAALLAACALVLTVHLATFTDATFVTSFWVALWLLWFGAGAHRRDPDHALHGRALAVGVVAVVFLGGVVGKLTPEYTGGEAFHQLYFLGKEQWPWSWLRESRSPEELRSLATWFSRGAIGGELLVAATPLLPHRLAVGVGCAVMIGMVAISTVMLFSVMACLVGLLLASLALADPRATGAAPRA
jgi:hypothetical protein